jgi:hypothetical protein
MKPTTPYKIELEPRTRTIANVRDEWVYVGFGNLNAAADALGMTRQAVSHLYRNGIRNREVAIKVHTALAERGMRIPVGELLELPDIQWRGPDRHGNDGNGATGNGAAKRPVRSRGAAASEPSRLTAKDPNAPKLQLGERQGRRCVERIITRRYSAPRRQVAA